MYKRILSAKLTVLAAKYPVLSITGPRQSGKTTIAKQTFPSYDYVSLENPDQRQRALSDPRGFLENYKNPVIIDEAQLAPELFSYIQGIVDEEMKMGRFILTGSQNFLLLERLSQSLAGRVAVLKLLPLNLLEMKRADIISRNINQLLFCGCYPALYNRKIDPNDWYSHYLQTYLERDVRSLKEISNLHAFQKFMQLCAGRVGQMVNLSEIGQECGMAHNTVKAWISVLEASYILFLLKPYHENFKKRLVKQPKLYFYDTGLACHLLGLENFNQIQTHPLRGALFECFVVSELMKQRMMLGQRENIYYWRDHSGHEIDVILVNADQINGVEIKSSATFSDSMLKGLDYWSKLAANPIENTTLIYCGDEQFTHKGIAVLPWSSIETLNSEHLNN